MARCFHSLLVLRRPSQAVGAVPSLYAANYLHGMQIDDGDITIGRTRYKSSRPAGLDQYPGCAVSDRNFLDGLMSCGVDDGHVRTAQRRDERKFSVKRKLQPIRAAYIRGESFPHLFASNIDDRHGSVLGVRHPNFSTVWRNIKTF